MTGFVHWFWETDEDDLMIALNEFGPTVTQINVNAGIGAGLKAYKSGVFDYKGCCDDVTNPVPWYFFFKLFLFVLPDCQSKISQI